MRTQQFNLSTKPLLDDDNVAYLVDSKNVKMHRQYVEKYYSAHDLDWFDTYFMEPIRNDKSQKLLLYYSNRFIRISHDISSETRYTIYNITNALMIVE